MRLMTILASDGEGADRRCSGPILTRTPCWGRAGRIMFDGSGLSQRMRRWGMNGPVWGWSANGVSSVVTPRMKTYNEYTRGAASFCFLCFLFSRRPGNLILRQGPIGASVYLDVRPRAFCDQGQTRRPARGP